MAFDGVTIAALAAEFNKTLAGTRVTKISQPEGDEIHMVLKGEGVQKKLLLSANASLPLVFFTQENKTSPLTAPTFCMLLRKHLQNARWVSVEQPGLERILRFVFEHYNEMGDLCRVSLILEMMGKHSNLILVDDRGIILDSIKRISSMVSSVREVLPGREYSMVCQQGKMDLFDNDWNDGQILQNHLDTSVESLFAAAFIGVSKSLSNLLLERVDIVAGMRVRDLSDANWEVVKKQWTTLCSEVKAHHFEAYILLDGKQEVEYGVLSLEAFGLAEREVMVFDEVSKMLEHYYLNRNKNNRAKQRSQDLRKLVTTLLERAVKKLELQEKQLDDTNKMESYRLYGELLQTYASQIASGAGEVCVDNYYDGSKVVISLDADENAIGNAKRYYEKYSKLKRTRDALQQHLVDTRAEVDYLQTVMNALAISVSEEDLLQIKEELSQGGYVRRKPGEKIKKVATKWMKFKSSDGFEIYVGRNNLQNEEITFRIAEGNDWWFHAKGIPGSHVIVRTMGKELPDRTYEEAASLAAHYSAAKGQERVEVDYVQRKHVKKPSAAKPGYVIYQTNYSMLIGTDISHLVLQKDS